MPRKRTLASNMTRYQIHFINILYIFLKKKQNRYKFIFSFIAWTDKWQKRLCMSEFMENTIILGIAVCRRVFVGFLLLKTTVKLHKFTVKKV